MAFPRNPNDGDLWVEGWLQYVYDDSVPGWLQTGIVGANVDFDTTSRITDLADAVDPGDAPNLAQVERIAGGSAGGVLDEIEYIHNQAIAAATWNIVHNLNQQWVLAQVVDNTGATVIPLTEYLSANSCRLVFGNPVSGRAIIRR